MTVLIGLVAYIAAVQLSATYNWRVSTGVLLAVVPPFIVSLLIEWAWLQGIPDVPIMRNLFDIATLVTFALTVAVAIFVFKQLQRAENESTSTWFGWAIGGGTIILFVIPMIIAPRLQFLG